MVKLTFENRESVIIQDRFIEELEIEGATDYYMQTGHEKLWAKDCKKVSLTFKPDKEINTVGLYDDVDITERLGAFSDITSIEVDGQTYFVPYDGKEINKLQDIKYLPNGDIQITIEGE